jgi:hypothetical protein
LLVKPAALLGSGKHLPHGFPEPERTVADGQHRGDHAAAAAIAQQIGPRLGGFPIPLCEGDEFLAAVSAAAV